MSSQRFAVERRDVMDKNWKIFSKHGSLRAAVRKLDREYREMHRLTGGDAWNADWRVVELGTGKIYDRMDAQFLAGEL